MKSVSDVISRFKKLENELHCSEYKMLHNFNQTYLIITRNVRVAIGRGEFEYPDFLEKFDVLFAKYYLFALNKYLNGKQAPPAWQEAFERCKQKKCSPLILMALGVNAHVNNDIAQVLYDLNAQKHHYSDYKKINNIIKESIYEVINKLDDKPGRYLLNPKRNLFRKLYRPLMSLLIRSWRYRAWRNYRLMKRSNTSVEELERQAYIKSTRLTRLPV